MSQSVRQRSHSDAGENSASPLQRIVASEKRKKRRSQRMRKDDEGIASLHAQLAQEANRRRSSPSSETTSVMSTQGESSTINERPVTSGDETSKANSKGNSLRSRLGNLKFGSGRVKSMLGRGGESGSATDHSSSLESSPIKSSGPAQPQQPPSPRAVWLACAKAGDAESCSILLENCQTKQEKNELLLYENKRQQTALILAISEGHENVVQLLVNADTDRVVLEKSDFNKWTPLHHACSEKHVQIAALLLKKGHSPNVGNIDGSTPLHYAIRISPRHQTEDLLDLFAAHGAQLDARTAQNETPLHQAALRGNFANAAWLLARGADPNLRDVFGHTPLHKAALNGSKYAVATLLDHGVDRLTQSNDGETARDLAVQFNMSEVVAYFDEYERELVLTREIDAKVQQEASNVPWVNPNTRAGDSDNDENDHEHNDKLPSGVGESTSDDTSATADEAMHRHLMTALSGAVDTGTSREHDSDDDDDEGIIGPPRTDSPPLPPPTGPPPESSKNGRAHDSDSSSDESGPALPSAIPRFGDTPHFKTALDVIDSDQMRTPATPASPAVDNNTNNNNNSNNSNSSSSTNDGSGSGRRSSGSNTPTTRRRHRTTRRASRASLDRPTTEAPSPAAAAAALNQSADRPMLSRNDRKRSNAAVKAFVTDVRTDPTKLMPHLPIGKPNTERVKGFELELGSYNYQLSMLADPSVAKIEAPNDYYASLFAPYMHAHYTGYVEYGHKSEPILLTVRLDSNAANNVVGVVDCRISDVRAVERVDSTSSSTEAASDRSVGAAAALAQSAASISHTSSPRSSLPRSSSALSTSTSSTSPAAYLCLLWTKRWNKLLKVTSPGGLQSTFSNPSKEFRRSLQTLCKNYHLFGSVDKLHMSLSPIPTDVDIDKQCRFAEKTDPQKSRQHCIGVVYAGADQTTEDEIFNNTKASPAFWQFCAWLGELIRLKGFQGFRGDLDVKTDTTGKYSYYTRHDVHEVMFHVAPMLPEMVGAEQQLVRKRRIGNDMTVIVFQEAGGTYTPPIQSQVLHNYVVVTPIVHRGITFYKISVSRRAGVDKFGPPLVLPSVYERNSSLRKYLVAKCINANLAAMRSPGLASKIAIPAKQQFLSDFATQHCKK